MNNVNITDCVSQYFNQKGCEVTEEMMGSSPIKLGNAINWQQSKLVYKVDDDVLLIVSYERTSKNGGLRSGFKDLMDWLHEIKSNVRQIRYVTGRVNALEATDVERGLTTKKLLRFYQDIMKTPLALDLGDSWFRFDLNYLKDFRAHYKKSDNLKMKQ